MRILLKCSECARRYDASRVKIGARVRCHCGHVMRVHQPRSHESIVVRCSACGAPREARSDHCGFCHSDFTLHERDLHTVCPECMTRVSDRAKFCHHCAARLTAEAVAGKKSPWTCPECGQQEKLLSRQLGREKINVAECQKCAGLWIALESFTELRDRVARDAKHVARLDLLPPKPADSVAVQGKQRYRPCPRCQKLMTRRQYARGSGVIIDICREHGMWFDAHELGAVLDWIARGGHVIESTDQQAQQQQERMRRMEAELKARQMLQRPQHAPRDPIDTLIEDVLDTVLDPLSKFFHIR
jgi:Zn-finger nucleic acid-binding protein